jgi:hypothetical protein
MYRIDTNNSVATPPTPAALGTEGYFKDGAVGVGDGTTFDSAYANMLQETILHLLDEQGVAHTKTGFDGLTLAVVAKIAEQILVSGNAATEAKRGAIEVATDTEAKTGTDDTRAITPLKLFDSLEMGHVPGVGGYLWIRPRDLLINWLEINNSQDGDLVPLVVAYVNVADYECYGVHFRPSGGSQWATWTPVSGADVRVNRQSSGMRVLGLFVGTLAA